MLENLKIVPGSAILWTSLSQQTLISILEVGIPSEKQLIQLVSSKHRGS